MKKFVMGAVLLASMSAFAAFTSTMTADEVTAEVNARIANKESLETIAAAAQAAGAPASLVQSALASKFNATRVFDAMVAANFDPASITSPTAAGGGQTAGNAAGGDSGSPGNAGGGSTGSFGSSRSSSVGGGGSSGSGAASPN